MLCGYRWVGDPKRVDEVMEKLKERLKIHEGLSLVGYQDTHGNWGLGYGHNLTYPIPIEAAEIILNHDIAVAVSEFYKLPLNIQRNLNNTRKRAVVEMIFNMGLPRALTFKKMFKAIETSDFDVAAAEMLDSRWAGQVGQRAVELAETMRHGTEFDVHEDDPYP